MHRMLPPGLRGDFQDLPSWRDSVRELLRYTLRGYPGPVIVPMTLANPGYFAEIVGALRADGFDVRHFALLAEPATVLARIRKRGLVPGLRRRRGRRCHRRIGRDRHRASRRRAAASVAAPPGHVHPSHQVRLIPRGSKAEQSQPVVP